MSCTVSRSLASAIKTEVTSTMKKDVNAVVVQETVGGDLEEPLIQKDGDNAQSADENSLGENTELPRYFRFIGFLFGSIYSAISLLASAVLAKVFGEHPEIVCLEDKILYYALFAFSNSWLLMFPIVCVVAVERSWTECGNRYLKEKLLCHRFTTCDNHNNHHPLSKRAVFLAGVNFLLGIVFGSYAVWCAVDLYIGTAAEMFAALVISFIVCTTLCYALIVVYDSCSDEIEADEAEDDSC